MASTACQPARRPGTRLTRHLAVTSSSTSITTAAFFISFIIAATLPRSVEALTTGGVRSEVSSPFTFEMLQGSESTGKGILIGMLSALGSAALVALVAALIYFFKYTSRGRILLDRMGRPGDYDDEQAFLRDEAEALETMDELQRAEYFRAKGFIEHNPPESMHTDISLSQYLAIQEKGVSAWEFEAELEIANCFVEARTEIEFFDSECSVQSNLPVPKQNEVYYWEAKIYDKPENSIISIGMSTKPYPMFRLPGLHKHSVAYISNGTRRHNQPFNPTPYGVPYMQGDVIGVGYRPRNGAIFFTRNGKKLEEVVHGLKSQNFFPTVGAIGPSIVHVNFGQTGFVYIEANVKKWGLAPMTGSLPPPPPYGSEQGSILLESGREGVSPGQASFMQHGRSRSGQVRYLPPTSPGPTRSPTDISLAQLSHVSTNEDHGEGSSHSNPNTFPSIGITLGLNPPPAGRRSTISQADHLTADPEERAPPEYSSPSGSDDGDERRPLISNDRAPDSPPIPSYDAAMRDTPSQIDLTGDHSASSRESSRSGSRSR